ncbi:hypothetical protein SAMN02745194_04314 [Roseomonas rosea]|uniref:Lipoprotein LpqN n=1 Tax=Muricoccus roseus TaxID=198092 RepID=A0A1M6Q7E1_9PROT|nr:hypothetical protein [Roseomonas rosea]SHK16060.1 hypothetical protein SAMN02745194_04314 [Roseomonas rosea]
MRLVLKKGMAPAGAIRMRAVLAPVLLAGGLLAGCAVPEEASAPRERQPAEAVLGRLPAQVAGFERGAVQDVAPNDPGAGKVVEYTTPRRVAVAFVFLYDMGRPNVTQAELPAEVERAVSEATALPSDRTGRQLSVASRSPLPVPGGDLSCAALEGTFGRNRVERQVCVGVAGGRFLRVQVTMPSRGGAPVADAQAFTTAIAAAARGG